MKSLSFTVTSSCVLTGIELMHMIRKGQFAIDGVNVMSSPTSFMRWQNKSAQFKKASSIHREIIFSEQRDKTVLIAYPQQVHSPYNAHL